MQLAIALQNPASIPVNRRLKYAEDGKATPVTFVHWVDEGDMISLHFSHKDQQIEILLRWSKIPSLPSIGIVLGTPTNREAATDDEADGEGAISY